LAAGAFASVADLGVVLAELAKLVAPMASTKTALVTAVPTTANLLSFRFFIMTLPDLLDSTAPLAISMLEKAGYRFLGENPSISP
jgi:hypothetical protein